MAPGLASIRTLAALLALALLCALVRPDRADAAVSTCSISSTGLIFSPYDTQTKAQVDGAGTISVTCTGSGKSTNLSLNLGGGNAGTCTDRKMANGTAMLTYNIFRDSSRVSNWCDGGSKLDIEMDFATGATQTRTYTMYGRVSLGQNPTFATYTDLLTVTLKQGGGTIATGTTSISGSVAPTCSVTAGTLGFGSYSSASAALASAGVSVNCSNGATYQVGLDGGQNVSGSTRRMTGPGGAMLSYQLFRDSLRTVAWGDGSALGARVSGTGSGSAQALTVYGRIPAGQMPTPGSYTDSVIVTVEY
jgi:spore coat protein U-like protein